MKTSFSGRISIAFVASANTFPRASAAWKTNKMSRIANAKNELNAINFGEDDTKVMIDILERFFDQWDSGGAVRVVAPILQRLIAGKALSPLTGADDEWMEVGTGLFQNIRCSSVFKDPRFHDGKLAFDIDAPNPHAAISFPYWSDIAEVASPVITVDNSSPT